MMDLSSRHPLMVFVLFVLGRIGDDFQKDAQKLLKGTDRLPVSH